MRRRSLLCLVVCSVFLAASLVQAAADPVTSEKPAATAPETHKARHHRPPSALKKAEEPEKAKSRQAAAAGQKAKAGEKKAAEKAEKKAVKPIVVQLTIQGEYPEGPRRRACSANCSRRWRRSSSGWMQRPPTRTSAPYG